MLTASASYSFVYQIFYFKLIVCAESYHKWIAAILPTIKRFLFWRKEINEVFTFGSSHK